MHSMHSEIGSMLLKRLARPQIADIEEVLILQLDRLHAACKNDLLAPVPQLRQIPYNQAAILQ